MGIFSRFFKKSQSLSPQPSNSWHTLVHEPFTGAWQQGKELKVQDASIFFAVFACATKIAQDIAKMPLLTKRKKGDVWQVREIDRLTWLKKPNDYQTMQQFIECWLLSKLFNGNTYVYKQRDNFGKLIALHILNPRLVKPLIADNGAVWYSTGQDNLTQLSDGSITLPASEIIHDRWNCFYHHLVGLSPILASNLAASSGTAIQRNSWWFFKNRAMPQGILTAPGHIDSEKAAKLAERWNANYSGENAGKTPVLGDGMTYNQLSMSALDSQLVEQLKLSAEIVCSTFKMPPFLIGFGSLPAGMKVSDLNELYYSGCLQTLIEAIENLLSAETSNAQVEFDLASLIRMDAQSQMQILAEGVKASVLTINEARHKQDLPPVDGGDTPYMQQQNYSLAALAKRDTQSQPFTPTPKNDNHDTHP